MKTIYDGLAVLDANGQAVVDLPDWFEALNRDFRYQLTAIGSPAPDLHIAEEIASNRFRIAGALRAGAYPGRLPRSAATPMPSTTASRSRRKSRQPSAASISTR